MTPLPKLVLTRRDSPEDAVALKRISNGEMSALAPLYDRHAEPLMRFAVRMCGRTDAEDLLQATFIKAAEIAARYDGRGVSARAWLFGIMAKLAQDRRRSVARFARAAARFASGARDADHPRPDERVGIEGALAKISPAKRTVLILAEIEGYTCEQIAAMLSVPVGTVWTRLHHGRRELHALFEGSTR